jgi:hypothetical protein
VNKELPSGQTEEKQSEDSFEFLKYEKTNQAQQSHNRPKKSSAKKPFEFDKISNLKSVLKTRISSKNNSGSRIMGERK